MIFTLQVQVIVDTLRVVSICKQALCNNSLTGMLLRFLELNVYFWVFV